MLPGRKTRTSPLSPDPWYPGQPGMQADGALTPPVVLAPDDVLVRIKAICDEFECYGYRRVGAALRHQGVDVGQSPRVPQWRRNSQSAAGEFRLGGADFMPLWEGFSAASFLRESWRNQGVRARLRTGSHSKSNTTAGKTVAETQGHPTTTAP
jgi:HTH-like domain